MKNKTLKKLMLPFFLVALCFITSKPPVTLPNLSESKLSQIMPLSDMEENDAIKDE